MKQRRPSRQMALLLDFLTDAPAAWVHGYDIMQATGLKSGTLYPLLMRMSERGLLESRWQPPSSDGRPPRHEYRLTAQGEALARSTRQPDEGPARA